MLVDKNKKREDAEVPQGSLADISFLILIFFMVSTTINMDKGIGLILPGEGQEKEIYKENITNVMVDPRGNVLLDEKQVEMQNLSGELRQILSEKPDMIFSVKTHPKTKYQDYIDVLDKLKTVNAKNISIAQ
ncbi:MAG: biopolymer transporter ExbD [Candidatus Marinimicrobia bacterium]|nr:biopolymer transporter ExbD [Candidatus Neomarinimicrobiota bacterium]